MSVIHGGDVWRGPSPDEILDFSAGYIRIIFAAIPCCVLYNMASGILRALGDSRTPVVFLVMASLVNIALDLFLIIACGMDVAGAAVATAASQAPDPSRLCPQPWPEPPAVIGHCCGFAAS